VKKITWKIYLLLSSNKNLLNTKFHILGESERAQQESGAHG
jgi:hypothetical protein